jgi:hypothetical protein
VIVKKEIDVAISGDRNVIKKENKKILKYKDLTIEIQRMWNVKTNVIPVIRRVIGSIPNSFRKIPEQRTGKAHQGTTENSTNVQYSRFNIGKTVMCTTNSNYRIAATLFPRDMVLFQEHQRKYPA